MCLCACMRHRTGKGEAFRVGDRLKMVKRTVVGSVTTRRHMKPTCRASPAASRAGEEGPSEAPKMRPTQRRGRHDLEKESRRKIQKESRKEKGSTVGIHERICGAAARFGLEVGTAPSAAANFQPRAPRIQRKIGALRIPWALRIQHKTAATVNVRTQEAIEDINSWGASDSTQNSCRFTGSVRRKPHKVTYFAVRPS